MMNAIGGTSLHYWAQHWRLNPWDFKVVSETKRRYGASRIPKGSTVEDWPFGYDELEPYYDKIEYEARRVGPGRQRQRQDRSARQSVRGAAQARVPDAAAALDRVPREDGGRGEATRLASVPRPGGDQLADATRTARAACTTASATPAAATSTRRTPPPSRRFRARRRPDHFKAVTGATVTSIDVDSQGRASGVTYVVERRGVLPAGEGRAARELHVRELAPAAAVEVEGVSQRALEQSRPGRDATTSAITRARRSRRCSRSTSAPGTGCRRRASRSTTGPTTTSITRRSTSSAAAICGRCRIAGPIGAAGMNTFGLAPSWGSQWKAFIKQNADRSHSSYIQKTTLPYEDNYLDLDPVVKDPLGLPVIRITGEFKENERKIAAFSQDKMEQWYRAAGAIADRARRRSAARWARRRTPTAARAWATTPRRMSSIAGGCRTRCRTSASSAAR